MNIAYPVSEILKCVETINQPEGKIYNNSDKTFNLNNTVSMKKKITQTQGTFGETIETEELIEETFDDAEPFEIDEITKIEINELIVEKDGTIRPNTSQKILNGLKLAFDEKGTINAGTASPFTDGASATLICNEWYIHFG